MSEQAIQELKPCPFCGSEAHLQDVADSSMCFVVCLGKTCWCAVGENYDRDAMPDHKFYSREDAVAAWNTRADTSIVAAKDAEIIALKHSRDVFAKGLENEEADCEANEKLAAYEQAHPPADLPPQTAIQTENCCVCGKQTVYKCPWDHRQLCGEITCRETHEERGECSRTGSAPPPSEKGKP